MVRLTKSGVEWTNHCGKLSKSKSVEGAIAASRRHEVKCERCQEILARKKAWLDEHWERTVGADGTVTSVWKG
jgi:hypothetical protein